MTGLRQVREKFNQDLAILLIRMIVGYAQSAALKNLKGHAGPLGPRHSDAPAPALRQAAGLVRLQRCTCWPRCADCNTLASQQRNYEMSQRCCYPVTLTVQARCDSSCHCHIEGMSTAVGLLR